MSDESSGPSRPVEETPREDQQRLFGPSPAPPGETSQQEAAQREGSKRFVERDPEEITIGGMPLGEYLKKRDQEWVLVMRERLREVDWSDWEQQYEGGGRPPYHPAPMVALIIYGIVNANSSLRELEEVAELDLGCMWLTGGLQPDHATVGRFIHRHADQFEGEGFLELTETILEIIPQVDREVAADGTVLEAFASELSQLKAEAAKEWANEQLDGQADETPDKRKKGEGGTAGDASGPSEETRAERLLGYIRLRLEERSHRTGRPEDAKFSRTEPSAVWHQHKDGGYAFGYRTSVIANRQRFIVGHAVDRTREQAVLGELLDQAETILGEVSGTSTDEKQPIERLSLDNNYYTLGVLEEVVDRGLDALIYPDNWAPDSGDDKPKRGGKFAKEAFEYVPDKDVYRCPAGEELEWVRSGTDRLGRSQDSYGRSDACADCPLREDCTTARRGRTVKRYEGDHLKEAMRKVFEQPRAREAYSRRMGIVEPVFADLEQRGLRRLNRSGVRGAATEVALHSIGHNFSRLRTYIDSGRLDVSNLTPQTGSYREAPRDTRQTDSFFAVQHPSTRSEALHAAALPIPIKATASTVRPVGGRGLSPHVIPGGRAALPPSSRLPHHNPRG